MNRSAISQALAKSLAYKTAGKDAMANEWAACLVALLADEGIYADLEQVRKASLAPRHTSTKSSFNTLFQS